MAKRSNQLSRGGAGGGMGSRVVRPGPARMGQPAREQRPRGVSQIGQNMGNHATNSGRVLRGGVEPVRGAAMPSVPLGNEVAKNVGAGGPGRGRTVMTSGTQGQHGPVAGEPAPASGRPVVLEPGRR
jgi:hypothetical protein